MAAAGALFGPLFRATEGPVSAQETVNRKSAPSDLKITDVRACRVAANYDYSIVKFNTNQGVYGLGEVRDARVEGMALILKPYLVGRNPRTVRQFAVHGRMGRIERGGHHGHAPHRREGGWGSRVPADRHETARSGSENLCASAKRWGAMPNSRVAGLPAALTSSHRRRRV
jgi:hypothetical protein